MPPSAEAIARYRSRLATYQDSVAASLLAIWDELDTYDDAAMKRFIAKAEPLLAGAKAATVATSTAFFALATGVRPPSVAAKDVEVEARITHPFLATWHALKVGRPVEDAIAAGRSQAEAIGPDYVTSTARRTGDYAAKVSRQNVRWKRVPRGKACSWCRVVSGQTYRTAASADFGHDRCSCIAVPT